MNLLEFRTQLAADLGQCVPSGVKVAVHPGRFTLDEIERYAVEAPCVRVAVLGSADDDLQQPYDTVECSAYVLTKTGKAGLPDAQMLTLATGLKAYLRLFPVGGAEAGAPTQVKFANLYSTAVGRDGIALGAVTWRQRIPLDAPTTGDLQDFLAFYGSFDVGQDAEAPVSVAAATLPAASA